MSRNVEYDLVEAADRAALVRTVNDRISEGWEPLAGPCAADGRLLQAVVRAGGGKRIRKTSED
jgi:hypothetical protein